MYIILNIELDLYLERFEIVNLAFKYSAMRRKWVLCLVMFYYVLLYYYNNNTNIMLLVLLLHLYLVYFIYSQS